MSQKGSTRTRIFGVRLSMPGIKPCTLTSHVKAWTSQASLPLLCSAMNCVLWFVMCGVICYFLCYFVCAVCCSVSYAVWSKLNIMILGAVYYLLSTVQCAIYCVALNWHYGRKIIFIDITQFFIESGVNAVIK